MRTFFIAVIFLFLPKIFSAQLLLNGDFSLGTLFWGCNPETNSETTYGGSSGLNTVAEVDALSGLCQTVSGLSIGNVYALSFSASRRTGGCPGPLVTNIDITISGGVLLATVTRTNTTFGFTTTGLLFTPISTSHVITFSAGAGFGGSTCGMIIDNIAITTSGLPVELSKFAAAAKDDGVQLTWSTATERNSARFDVEKSKDGLDFKPVVSVPTKAPFGNSSTNINYETNDGQPYTGTSYYRLKQVDADEEFRYSKIVAATFNGPAKGDIVVYPNPNKGNFTVDILAQAKSQLTVKLVGSLGKVVYSQSYSLDAGLNSIHMNLEEKVSMGNYHCLLLTDNNSRSFPVIIE